MWNVSRSKSLQTASPTESCPHPPSAFPLGFRMSNWPASKARRALAALERIGWRVQRQRGSHRLLTRPGWPDYEFAFHDRDEIGPRMPAGNGIGVMPHNTIWGPKIVAALTRRQDCDILPTVSRTSLKKGRANLYIAYAGTFTNNLYAHETCIRTQPSI